jgi:endonuclease IV
MKDRHSVILDGKISVAEMNDFIASLSATHIPTIILETPTDNYKMEINHIRNLLD